MKKKFLVVGFFALLLCIQENSFAQRKPQPKDAMVFEIEKISNPGSMGRSRTSTHIFYFYASGRVACRSTTYDPRGKEFKSFRSKCVQLTKAKISELIELAEKTDFLEAKEDYRFFRGGKDHGTWLSIVFYRKEGNKTIDLTIPRQSENNGALPASVTVFLEKIAVIDDNLQVEREIPADGENP